MPREYIKFNNNPKLKQNLIDDYLNNMPQNQIKAKYKTAYETYKKVLITEGVWDEDRHYKSNKASGFRRRKSNAEKLLVRNSESDYWLGILLADGTISEKRNLITLGLKDLDHIQKFHCFLESNAKIHKRIDTRYDSKPIMYKTSTTSKKVVAYFSSIGLKPAKSKNLDFKLNLNWNILRGIVDGDGYIGCKRIDIATASTKFKDQIISFLISEGFTPKVYNKKNYQKNSDNFYTIRIARKKEVFNFIDKLYLNAHVFLTRKHDKARLMQKSLGQHLSNSGNQH
jgi:hypothetical protein